MQRPTVRDDVADAFAQESGAKQVGVIVHGPTINHEVFEDEQEMLGLLPVRCNGHSRLYKIPEAKK